MSGEEGELAAARAEVEALRGRLAAIEASTAWRIVAPVIGFVDRHPALHLVLWAVSFRTGRIREYLAGRRLVRLLLRQPWRWEPDFYRGQRADLAAPGLDLLRHYAFRGRGEGLRPVPAFDPAWYAAAVGTTVADAPLHWLEHGQELPTNRVAALRARQAEALGQAMPPGRLAIGVVTFDNPRPMLERLLRSIRVSARVAGIDADVLLLDNGGPASAGLGDSAGVRVLATGGNVGFGAAHNRLMEAAFAEGAAHYLALNPDAALHPEALRALLRMSQASGGRALVEALQFPAEHQVPYDVETFDTPWASGACMLIPRVVHAAVGGFDDGFFMYCEDVDISWRARAAGFRAQTCPAALLFHPMTNRVLDRETQLRFLQSGLRLAEKWGGATFAARTRAELGRLGMAVPDLSGLVPAADPGGVADFEHEYSFAPGRW